MKIFRSLRPSNQKIASGMTIGNFDGCHVAHQKILRRLISLSNQFNVSSVVVLFEPQPEEFFNNHNAAPRLMTFREKVEYMRDVGIDYVYPISFNQHIASLKPEKFFQDIVLQNFDLKFFLAGHDFCFGKNKSGDLNCLYKLSKQYNFSLYEEPAQFVNNKKVSSTLIRNILHQGHLSSAKQYLQRDYSISGKVIHGNKKGARLGWPTANIGLKRLNCVLSGVFAVTIEGLGSTKYGIANIGKRPTIGGKDRILEIHIFDFDKKIYGSYLKIHFIKKIREEIKFSTVKLLKMQIIKDAMMVKNFYKMYEKENYNV